MQQSCDKKSSKSNIILNIRETEEIFEEVASFLGPRHKELFTTDHSQAEQDDRC